MGKQPGAGGFVHQIGPGDPGGRIRDRNVGQRRLERLAAGDVPRDVLDRGQLAGLRIEKQLWLSLICRLNRKNLEKFIFLLRIIRFKSAQPILQKILQKFSSIKLQI